MKLTATVLSHIFQPLFIPLYGILLFFYVSPFALLPVSLPYKLLTLGGTFFFTALIPGLSVLYMMKTGQVSDIFISNRRQRTLPYVYTLISYLLDTLLSGGTPELTPCGQVWDYLYFTDAAKAFASVLEKGRDGAVYPLGSGMPRKLKEYVCALRDLAAPQAELKFGAKEYYPHQPMVLAADISELTADTGWAPEMSFEDGIREMLKAREV